MILRSEHTLRQEIDILTRERSLMDNIQRDMKDLTSARSMQAAIIRSCRTDPTSKCLLYNIESIHQQSMLSDGCQFLRRLFGTLWSWFPTTMHFVLPSHYTSYKLPALHSTRVTGTRTLTLEPHTACRKGGWGLEYEIKRN